MTIKRIRVTEYVTETFDVEVDIPDYVEEGDAAYDHAVEQARVQYEGERMISVNDVDYEELPE